MWFSLHAANNSSAFRYPRFFAHVTQPFPEEHAVSPIFSKHAQQYFWLTLLIPPMAFCPLPYFCLIWHEELESTQIASAELADISAETTPVFFYFFDQPG